MLHTSFSITSTQRTREMSISSPSSIRGIKLSSVTDCASIRIWEPRINRKSPVTSPFAAASWKIVHNVSSTALECYATRGFGRTNHIQCRSVHSDGVCQVINNVVHDILHAEEFRIDIVYVSGDCTDVFSIPSRLVLGHCQLTFWRLAGPFE